MILVRFSFTDKKNKSANGSFKTTLHVSKTIINVGLFNVPKDLLHWDILQMQISDWNDNRQGVLLALFSYNLHQTEKLALAVKSTSQVVRHWVINLVLAINPTSMSMVMVC